jgi:hypothetical protein
VPETTVRYHAHHEGWQIERGAFQTKLAASLTEAAVRKDAKQILSERNDQTLKWTAEMRYAINALLKVRSDDGSVQLRKEIDMIDVRTAVIAWAELMRMDRLALGAATEHVQPAMVKDRIDQMSDAEVMAELERLRTLGSQTGSQRPN